MCSFFGCTLTETRDADTCRGALARKLDPTLDSAIVQAESNVHGWQLPWRAFDKPGVEGYGKAACAKFLSYLSTSGNFGSNQFAYQKERGARDALAFLVLDWIMSINKRRKVGVYCSDVSGAFDKVEKTRMVRKLRATGLHESVIAIFESWLRTRPANVIVSGDKSETIDLANMVFQGTVWGCMCWNVFFHDSKHAVRKSRCKEIVYADDLNAYKEYDRSVQNEDIIIDLEICQKDVHLWGAANQVVFD